MSKFHLVGRQANVPIGQRIFEVYVRLNKKASKTYPGSTGQSAIERWREDVAQAFNPKNKNYNRSICKAIREDGPDAFSVSVIAHTTDEIHAEWLEQRTMDRLLSLDPKWGYNDLRVMSEARMEELTPKIDINKFIFHPDDLDGRLKKYLVEGIMYAG